MINTNYICYVMNAINAYNDEFMEFKAPTLVNTTTTTPSQGFERIYYRNFPATADVVGCGYVKQYNEVADVTDKELMDVLQINNN